MADADTQAVLDKRFLAGEITTLYIPEILDGVVELKSRKDKITALRNNASYALMTFFKHVFDRSISFQLTGPEVRDVEFKGNPDMVDFDLADATLNQRYQIFNIFTVNNTPIDKQIKVLEAWFTTFHPQETELVCQMFERKLKYKGITEALIREAYPSLMEPKE